jgi:hypothetical protein
MTAIEHSRRFERKFEVPARYSGLARSLVRQTCRKDREYPEGRVNSLYFDSRDLDQYEISDSGDYAKNKVRIRWYGETLPDSGDVTVWVELKKRDGFACSKQRTNITIPVRDLSLSELQNGIIPAVRLEEILAGFGYFPPKQLGPVVMISYHRYRFNEMSTGFRVSVDEDIRAVIAAPTLARTEREIRVANGVIEVKGPTMDLPPTLRRMSFLDARWSRFSKYGTVLDLHFLGTAVR